MSCTIPHPDHRCLAFCLSLGTSALPNLSAAAEADMLALSEYDFLQEIPIVLSATRLQQPVSDTPIAVTVIDREMIRASGALEIADVFRLVPGFVVAHSNGSTPVVAYHGLSDQFQHRLQILVDGRAVYQPTFGDPAWNDLPLAIDDIERIEVIRGSNAAAYGSNSFMGVINIVTLHAASAPGAFARLTKGSNEVAEAFARAGDSRGGLSYRLTAGYRQDYGFDPFRPRNRYDHKRTHLANLRADYQHSAADTVLLQAGYAGGVRGDRLIPEDGSQYARWFDKEMERHFEQARWQHSVSPDEEFSLQLFFERSEVRDYTTQQVTIPGFGTLYPPFDESATGERSDFEFQHTLRPLTPVRLVWGFGTRLDSVSMPGFLGTNDYRHIRIHRLFAHTEWQVTPQLLANVGAMIEDHELTGTDTSPRASLNYHITENHTMRVAAARAYRAPFAIEEFADFRLELHPALPPYLSYFSSGNLDTEKLTSYEIGYVGRAADVGLDMELRFFYEKLEDIVTSREIHPNDLGIMDVFNTFLPGEDGYAFQFVNLDRAHVRGAESSLHYRPTRRDRLRFSYAYLRIDSTDRDPEYAYSDSAPKHSFSLLATHRTPEGVEASAAYYYVDSMTWLGGVGEPVNPTKRLDLRFGVPLKGPKVSGEVALVLQNLLGPYEDFRRRNQFDTEAFITASLIIL